MPRAQRVRGDQARDDIAVRDRRQRRQFCGKAHQQDHGAIGAEPAVAHDLQLRFEIAAAAESVGDVGKAILVQRACHDGAAAQRQCGGSQIGHAEDRRPRHSNPTAAPISAPTTGNIRCARTKFVGIAPSGCGIGSRVRNATAVLKSSNHSFMEMSGESV
jgi:hypothetical protein